MKKHVLQFVGSFNQGGSERQALALARGLRDEGSFEVSIATLNRQGVLRSEAQSIVSSEIPEYPLTSFFSAGFVSQVRKCAKYLRENGVDVVHTHDFYTNVFGMAAALIAGTRARIASKRETLGMRSSNQVRVEKLAFATANAIVVNSKAVGTYLQGLGVSGQKISLIYNGLDLMRFADPQTIAPGFKAGLAIPASTKLVILVANLRHDVKNIPMFLRAAKQILQNVPQTAFLIAGEGELQAGLEHLAADLGISQNVFFIGRCADVPRLLAASDVCVLTSTAEGFSNSILEYMAAGKPVVATAVGGASEAIVDGVTGFLVESNDDQDLATKVTELLSDPSMSAAFGFAGRERVEKKFSVSAQIEKTIDLYNSLLK